MNNSIELHDAIAFREGDLILNGANPQSTPLRFSVSVVVRSDGLTPRRHPKRLYDEDGRLTDWWITSSDEDFIELEMDLRPWLCGSCSGWSETNQEVA